VKGILLWLFGIPVPMILGLYLLGWLSPRPGRGRVRSLWADATATVWK
jgi:hypothetical protein